MRRTAVLLALCGVILILGALLFTLRACAANAPTPSPTPPPTPAPTPTPLPDVAIGGLRVSADTVHIDLAGRDVTLDALLAAFSGLPRLNSADLSGCPLSDADKAALTAAYPDIQYSWTVEFFDGQTLSSADTHLDISGVPVEDTEALAAKLALLPALRHVDMCGCGVDNAGMERLMEAFPHIRFVWLVRVSNFELRTDVKAFSMGQRKPVEGVRVLGRIHYPLITNEDIEPLKYCVDLIALDIGHAQKITDISCLAGLTKLRYLVVAIMRVSDLSPVENMQELVYLECFNNRIADISPVTKLPKLKYLNCGMNPFTDGTPLMGMTQLERLWMNSASISRTQWRELAAALPDTQFSCAFDSDPSAFGWRRDNQGYLDMQALFGLRALGQ